MRAAVKSTILCSTFALFGVCALVGAANAKDRQSITLSTGEALSVDLSSQPPQQRSRASAILQPFEAAAAGAIWTAQGYSLKPISVKTGQGEIPKAPPVEYGILKLKFLEYPSGQRMLIVENGYDRALTYRAYLRNGGNRSRTTVCLVMPRKRTIEHWPYKVDSVELEKLALTDWRPGDPMPCK